MGLDFLPAWPPTVTQPVLFGALLALGLIVGEAARRYLALPRITGYVLAGVALGPHGTGLLGPEGIAAARPLVDLSVGLIVFELGFRLDAQWLKRNRWLFVTAVAESLFCFAAIYAAMAWLGYGALLSAAAAAIGTATSPAVVMLVAHEQRAQGQITERMLLFTAVNSVFAYVALTLLMPLLHVEQQAAGWREAVLHPLYVLVGSGLAGLVACLLMLGLAEWLGKREDRQFVLLVAIVVLTVGAVHSLNLSVMFALVTLGMLARNLDSRHVLLPLRFGYGGQLFFVILFVLSGAGLEFSGFAAALPVAAFIAARFLGKAAALLAFGMPSGIRAGSAGLLSVALLPMSGFAVVMVSDTASLYPGSGGQLFSVVLAAIAVLELAGPLATQFALRRAGEAHPEAERAPLPRQQMP